MDGKWIDVYMPEIKISNEYNNVYGIISTDYELTIKDDLDAILGIMYKYGYIPKHLLIEKISDSITITVSSDKIISALLGLGIIAEVQNDNEIIDCYYPTTNLEKFLTNNSIENKRSKSHIPNTKLEEDIFTMNLCIDILLGKNDIVNKYKVGDARLGYFNTKYNSLKGNEIILSNEIGSTHTYARYPDLKIDLYNEKQNDETNRFSRELQDPKYFALVEKYTVTKESMSIMGEDKSYDNYNIHIPKIVIPYIRDEYMNPQSIAIEIENTTKGSYDRLFRMYSNNLDLFKTLIIYVRGNNSLKSIQNSMKKFDLGDLEVVIQEI